MKGAMKREKNKRERDEGCNKERKEREREKGERKRLEARETGMTIERGEKEN